MALPTKLHGFHPTQPISVPGTQQDTLKGPVHHMAEHHEGQEGLMSRLDQQEEWDVSVTRIGISQEKKWAETAQIRLYRSQTLGFRHQQWGIRVSTTWAQNKHETVEADDSTTIRLHIYIYIYIYMYIYI